MSIAPNTQTLPIPLTHNWPRWAIKFIPLVLSLGIATGIGTGTVGLTTSLNYYQSLSKDLTESLEERATSRQFSSVIQSCLTLCDPMDWSTPGFPVHHQLLEPVQTHVHQVNDAIQSSQTLASPSPPAFNLSQHQCLFQWVSFCYIKWD